MEDAFTHLKLCLAQPSELRVDSALEASPRKTSSCSDLCFQCLRNKKFRAGGDRPLPTVLLMPGGKRSYSGDPWAFPAHLLEPHKNFKRTSRAAGMDIPPPHPTGALRRLPFYRSEKLRGCRDSHSFQKNPPTVSAWGWRRCSPRLYFLSNDRRVSLVSWNWVLFACSQFPFLPFSSKESLLKCFLWALSRSPEGWYRKQRVSFLYKLLGCSHNSLKFICPPQPAIGQKN